MVIGMTGCTTSITSMRLSEFTEPPKGIIYSLPMLQYDLNLSWQITKCGNEPNVHVTAKIKELSNQDPHATFVLDYTSLASDVAILIRTSIK